MNKYNVKIYRIEIRKIYANIDAQDENEVRDKVLAGDYQIEESSPFEIECETSNYEIVGIEE